MQSSVVSWVFLFEKYKSEFLRKLILFKNICEEAIGNASIKICVENCGDFGNKPHIKDGLELLLESSVFALTFDVGHNAGADYSDEQTIIENIGRLQHMHIHDAINQRNHLSLGDGNVDLMKYLDLAKERNRRVVLEVKTVEGLRRSVEWLKEKDYL